MPEKFDGIRSKLRAFLIQLRLKVATYPDEQAKLRLAVNCLTGEAMDQVQSYVENDKVNLANLAALIAILIPLSAIQTGLPRPSPNCRPCSKAPGSSRYTMVNSNVMPQISSGMR